MPILAKLESALPSPVSYYLDFSLQEDLEIFIRFTSTLGYKGLKIITKFNEMAANGLMVCLWIR